MTIPSPLDLFRLDDKVVLITGASSGLGVGFAQAVAAVGGTLVIAARRTDRLEEVAEKLRVDGAEVLVRTTDVTDPDDCQALVDAAVAAYGRVDVLVNNAGMGASEPALRERDEVFRQVIDVNLNGSYWMARACAPNMPAGSSIINVASVHGLIASRFPQAPYAASKAGVIGLTRDLAQQWSARRGIRVNALCPGYFASEMTTDGEEALRTMVAEHSLLGRFGAQNELDAALLFLAGSGSTYVTGTTLVVDGGLAAI